MNRVCVVGLGYVGLPMSLMLAANGVQVTGVDINKNLVDTLREGKATFKENGIDELFQKALKNNIFNVN